MTHDARRPTASSTTRWRAYAIGALDADETRVFEAHLATCASCQAELRTMRRVVAGIGLADRAGGSRPTRSRRA